MRIKNWEAKTLAWAFDECPTSLSIIDGQNLGLGNHLILFWIIAQATFFTVRFEIFCSFFAHFHEKVTSFYEPLMHFRGVCARARAFIDFISLHNYYTINNWNYSIHGEFYKKSLYIFTFWVFFKFLGENTNVYSLVPFFF